MTTNKTAHIGHQPYRSRLPDERQAITHKFNVGGHEGYLTIGLYKSGRPGEVFIHVSKHGATMSGLIDGFATAISLCLQYNVPLDVLVDKFMHTQFEPQGITTNPEIPHVTSLIDYVFKYLKLKFGDLS